MDCCINDLRNKEVINVTNGKRLGYVSDIEVDINDARLLAISVPGESGIFSRAPDIKIPWACIEHIGEDLIIVNMKNITQQMRESVTEIHFYTACFVYTSILFVWKKFIDFQK